jgi:aminopeptidase N
MIQYFDSLFGAYPFSEYGVVIADGDIPPCNKNYGGAEETQTMSIHCPTSSMTEEWAIAHELAHQWFGDSVSLKNWQDIWLKEGMATYAQWLWLARGQDLDALNKVVKAEISDYFPFTRTGQPPADDLYRDEVYRGGALVFHVLRLKIGDEAFFKTLRTYLDKYRYGNAGTDEFIAVAEQVSGQDLRAFLNAWLSQTKLPEMPEPLK